MWFDWLGTILFLRQEARLKSWSAIHKSPMGELTSSAIASFRYWSQDSSIGVLVYCVYWFFKPVLWFCTRSHVYCRYFNSSDNFLNVYFFKRCQNLSRLPVVFVQEIRILPWISVLFLRYDKISIHTLEFYAGIRGLNRFDWSMKGIQYVEKLNWNSVNQTSELLTRTLILLHILCTGYL